MNEQVNKIRATEVPNVARSSRLVTDTESTRLPRRTLEHQHDHDGGDGREPLRARQQELAVNRLQDSPEVDAYREAVGAPSLTQNDCVVVWNESRNFDLRQVTSPGAFLHTPKTPSTRASSTFTNGEAASLGGSSGCTAAPRTTAAGRTAASHDALDALVAGVPPPTVAVAPSDARKSAAGSRTSSLGSVTKCLENQKGEEMTGAQGDNGRNGQGRSEVDRIFNLLEHDPRPCHPAENGSTMSTVSAALSSPSASDEAVKGLAAGNAGGFGATAKSRKRRRHQHLQQESTRQPSANGGKENATNRPSVPSMGGPQQPSATESMDADSGAKLGSDLPTSNESGIASTGVGSASTGGSDPFQDLLREVQRKRASFTSSEAVEASAQPTALPEQPTSVATAPEGKLHPPEPRIVNRTPPPSRPADQGFVSKDEFEDIDFSLDDLALLDSMVQHASQPEAEEAGGPKSQDAVDSSVQLPQKQQAQSPDPFSDFPDMDFDALDKSIADHQVHRPPDQSTVVSHHSAPSPGFLQFTRYRISQVTEDSRGFIKALSVQFWTPSMLTDRNANVQTSSRSAADGMSTARPLIEGKPRIIDGEIHLSGDWYFTPLVEGDVVHVCSPSGQCNTRVDASGPLVLDTNSVDDLLLIVHPDMLLTPTTISEAVTCSRRAVLKNRLGSTGLSAKAPLFGTMRHAIFEEMMKVRDFSMVFAQQACEMIVRKNAETLVATGLSSRDAETEVLKVVPQIQEFVAEYTSFSGARIGKGGSSPNLVPAVGCVQPTVIFTAHDVEAIEDPIVSPELGLKGNIDMVVQATMTNSLTSHSAMDGFFACIELKTGHHQTAQHSHMAQLSLYTLMLNSCYGSDLARTSATANEGVLLYMNSEALKAVHVAPKMFEMKALIGNRNLVAIETRRSSRPRGLILEYQNENDSHNDSPSVRLLDPTPTLLPDVLRNSHMCERCYMNRECMAYAAAAEEFNSGPREGSILQTHKDLLGKFTGRLSGGDLAYFVTWDRLVDLEGSACTSNAAEAWLVDSLEREKTTLRCISSLSFESGNDLDSSSVLLVFRRSNLSSQHNSFQNLSFEVGCHVLVSTDNTTVSSQVTWKRPRMCIVRGILDSSTESRVTIRASPDDLGRLRKYIRRSHDPTRLLFRIDRDEVATGLGTLRQNIVNFISQDATEQEINPNRLSWLRDVVIRLKTPTFDYTKKDAMFDPPVTASVGTFPGCDFMDLYLEYAELNDDQRAAADNVLAARDYSMIQGLPGTGKTSTIAFLARLLVAHGKRVLITSYTNSAVDNVLIKLMESGLAATSPGIPSPALLRVGRESSTHPHVHPILAASAAVALENSMSHEGDCKASLPSADYLTKCIHGARVVGVTALTLPRSPLLAREHFDVVIVDEAGQITQPAVLGALMSADSFILVGDHKQLPPLVASEAAEMGGFGESMLKRLAEAHPTSVAMLSYQYRMNREICTLSNEIAYNGALKCADESVANRKLDLPDFRQSLFAAMARDAWLARAIDPDFPVTFIDTDALRKSESDGTTVSLERTTGRNGGGSIVNDTEVEVVQQVIGGLLSCGVASSSIGVICPFRAQLRLLDDLDRVKAWKVQGLEVSTIDRYQGRDKDVIILSFVRSNSKGKVGRLLDDYRRLNVAVTRAKCKLVMIGSFSTLLKGSTHLRGSLERLQREGKVIPCGVNHS